MLVKYYQVFMYEIKQISMFIDKWKKMCIYFNNNESVYFIPVKYIYCVMVLVSELPNYTINLIDILRVHQG